MSNENDTKIENKNQEPDEQIDEKKRKDQPELDSDPKQTNKKIKKEKLLICHVCKNKENVCDEDCEHDWHIDCDDKYGKHRIVCDDCHWGCPICEEYFCLKDDNWEECIHCMETVCDDCIEKTYCDNSHICCTSCIGEFAKKCLACEKTICGNCKFCEDCPEIDNNGN